MLIPLLLMVTVVLGATIYSTLRAVILQGFDRKLSALSTVTGAFVDGEDHAAILKGRNETSPLYLRYVEPMRRIRARKELTFIYTQTLGDGAEITYVLDGQVGEGHSAIGDQDTLPEGELDGARAVLREGRVHLSEIRAWEQWGLLKSGFAPITDRTGRAVAMAGADVDISTIRSKTGTALAQVGLTSLLALLAATIVALRVARSLTRPIAALKEAALKVAAGQFGLALAVEHPRELAELAEGFSAMSETLSLTVRHWDDVRKELESRRCRLELSRQLAALGGVSPEGACQGRIDLAGGARTLVWLDTAVAVGQSSVATEGATGRGNRQPAAGNGRLRSHAESAAIIASATARFGEDADELLRRLDTLLGARVAGLALLDHLSGTLDVLARRPLRATITGLDVAGESRVLTGPCRLVLAPGETVELKAEGAPRGARARGSLGR